MMSRKRIIAYTLKCCIYFFKKKTVETLNLFYTYTGLPEASLIANVDNTCFIVRYFYVCKSVVFRLTVFFFCDTRYDKNLNVF